VILGASDGALSRGCEEEAAVAILSHTVSVSFREPVAIVAMPDCSSDEVDTPASLSSDDDVELLVSELKVEIRAEAIEKVEGDAC
jgi:hypothetical protein